MRVFLSVFLLLFGASVLMAPAEAASSRRKETSSSRKTVKKGAADAGKAAKKADGKITDANSGKKSSASAKVDEEAAKKAVEQEQEAPVEPEAVEPREFLRKSRPFQEGLRAMTDSLPNVAIRHFNDLLAINPPQNVLPYINRQLGEAYVRDRQYHEALQVLRKYPETAELPGARFWEAVACKGDGQYSMALRLFQSLEDSTALTEKEKSSLFWQEAEIYFLLNNLEKCREALQPLLNDGNADIRQATRLALAILEIQLNQPAKAYALVQDVVASPKKYSPYVVDYSRLIQARALIEEGKAREALNLLTTLLEDSKNLSRPRIVSLAKLAAAEAEIAVEKQGELYSGEEKGKGEDRVLAFIEAESDSPLLAQAFNILRRVDAFKDPEAYQKLQDWAKGKHSQRTPYAMAALAREAIARSEVVTLEELFDLAANQFPEHPASLDLQYLVLQYLYDQKKWDVAEKRVEKLPDGTARTLFMKAGLAYGKEQYEEATKLYKQALDLMRDSNLDWMQLVATNEALSAIQAQMASSLEGVLKDTALTPETYSHIRLEAALDSASRLEDGAMKELKDFVEQYPNHPRLADACLALGELALYQESPLVGETLSALSALDSLSLTPEEKERVARLRIILPESMEQWSAAIQAIRNYLDIYKEPALREPMQLKLGELLYRNNDFNQAHLYLQNMITRLPKDNPLRMPALFLSAKAAQQTNTQQSLNTALKLFEQVAEEDSAYKAAAEIEAASILMRQGKAEDVIKRLDAFVSGGKLNDESRRLALALSAEAWASLGSTNPEALKKARQMTARILEDPELPDVWRSRTLFQQARLSEMAGDNTEALRDYHLITSVRPESLQRKEWYWYYQAGFAAMHLLEEMKNWDGAIALAEYMAKSGGPRAEEAAKRARKIRLEHFVWGDDIFAERPEAQEEEKSHETEAKAPESVQGVSVEGK